MTSIKALTILLIVFYIAVLIQKNYSKNIRKESENPKKAIFPSMSPVPTSIPTLSPTAKPKNLPTSIPAPAVDNTNINSFIYPNSSIKEENSSRLVLQSTDDPQAITNWYKDKITSLGMNAKSFVQTNTNGNILNKLVAAKSGFKISVEVSKKSNEEKVEISVSLD